MNTNYIDKKIRLFRSFYESLLDGNDGTITEFEDNIYYEDSFKGNIGTIVDYKDGSYWVDLSGNGNTEAFDDCLWDIGEFPEAVGEILS